MSAIDRSRTIEDDSSVLRRREFGRMIVGLSGGSMLACSAPERVRAVADATDETGDDAAPPCLDGPVPLRVTKRLPLLTVGIYRGATPPFHDVTTCDYLDPDGTRGVRAVLIAVSALWCGPCGQYADYLAKLHREKYAALGARFLDLVVESSMLDPPATRADVDTWIKKHTTGIDVGLGQRSDFQNDAFPATWFVDPRTGIVVAKKAGFDATATTIPEIDDLLAKNAN